MQTRIMVAVFAAATVFGEALGFAADDFSGEPQNVSQSAGESVSPSLATDAAGMTYVVWEERASSSSSEIRQARAVRGIALPSVETPSPAATRATTPLVRSDGSYGIGAIWQARDANQNQFVSFAGALVLGVYTIGSRTDDTPPAAYGGSPRFAFGQDPKDVYAAWVDETGILRFRKSSDSGATFMGPELQISPSGISALMGDIAVSPKDGTIAVLWTEDDLDIMVRYSNDGGNSFLPLIHRITATPTTVSFNARARYDANGNLHVAWDEGGVVPGNLEVFYTRIPFGSLTPSSAMPLSTLDGMSSWQGDLALASNGDALVVWAETALGMKGVRLCRVSAVLVPSCSTVQATQAPISGVAVSGGPSGIAVAWSEWKGPSQKWEVLFEAASSPTVPAIQ